MHNEQTQALYVLYRGLIAENIPVAISQKVDCGPKNLVCRGTRFICRSLLVLQSHISQVRFYLARAVGFDMPYSYDDSSCESVLLVPELIWLVNLI